MTASIPFLIYPHQLFEDVTEAKRAKQVFLIEDPLFFNQFKFHAQKILLHRVSMRAYYQLLLKSGVRVAYIEAHQLTSTESIKSFVPGNSIRLFDPVDNWLERKLRRSFDTIELLESPNFLTPIDKVKNFYRGKKRYFFTEFYISQRKDHNILLQSDGSPEGGKWTFDTENRKPLPKNYRFASFPSPLNTAELIEARVYAKKVPSLGQDDSFAVPYTHKDAKKWLTKFINERLPLFGDYEDAFGRNELLLNHSYLTPMLNIGLLSPKAIITEVSKADVPINAKEGFLRQVLGWREYMRLVYINKGGNQRTKNFFNFTRKIPASFYDGTTGIEPIDTVIKRLLTHGYCHHIERLMVLGSFFLLCEFDPNEVYRWFMEFFIDSYDWVMVPNIYGMSQFSDGGDIVTKPYICSSNYIKKMSDYKTAPWCPVWDGLYWRFIEKHQDVIKKNPRMSIMIKQLEKMDGDKKRSIFSLADKFLKQLDTAG